MMTMVVMIERNSSLCWYRYHRYRYRYRYRVPYTGRSSYFSMYVGSSYYIIARGRLRRRRSMKHYVEARSTSTSASTRTRSRS